MFQDHHQLKTANPSSPRDQDPVPIHAMVHAIGSTPHVHMSFSQEYRIALTKPK